MSFLYWGAQNWTQHSPTGTEYRGIITHLNLLAMLLTNTTQNAASIQACLLPCFYPYSCTVLEGTEHMYIVSYSTMLAGCSEALCC